MPTLPTSAIAYYRTEEFTESTVPTPLLWSHTINKSGVWGRLRVTHGRVHYICLDAPTERTVLEPGVDGLIPPGESHKLELEGPVRFYLEFLREEPAQDAIADPACSALGFS